jgi:pyruvyltransferase
MEKNNFKNLLRELLIQPFKKYIIYPIIRIKEYILGINKIPLYWYNDRNWGDALNQVLVELLSGKKARYTPYQYCDRFLAIGSVLENANDRTEVWGSGFIKQGSKLTLQPKKIHAVRGPLTRAALLDNGVDCPEIYGDPALLLPLFYNPDIPKKYDVGIIPHYVDKNHPWIEKQLSESGVHIIDVRSDTWDFVRAVKSCKVVLSSSLHGLICSDSYGVSNAWIQLSNQVIGGDFKFRDYRLSIGAEEPKPFIVSSDTILEEIVSTAKTYNPKINLKKLLLSCPFISNENRNKVDLNNLNLAF